MCTSFLSILYRCPACGSNIRLGETEFLHDLCRVDSAILASLHENVSGVLSRTYAHDLLHLRIFRGQLGQSSVGVLCVLQHLGHSPETGDIGVSHLLLRLKQPV